jgi:hypothetical protein
VRAAQRQDTALYDKDFFAWTQQTAALLRAGRFQEIDTPHAADEIEDMGKRDLKELNSRMQVLIMHLLKWQLRPNQRSRSWHSTIVTQRLEIDALLRQSLSLQAELPNQIPHNYRGAVKRAAAEMGLARQDFPEECPFEVAQIVDEDFLPG